MDLKNDFQLAHWKTKLIDGNVGKEREGNQPSPGKTGGPLNSATHESNRFLVMRPHKFLFCLNYFGSGVFLSVY